jgi:hypothetical protein
MNEDFDILRKKQKIAGLFLILCFVSMLLNITFPDMLQTRHIKQLGRNLEDILYGFSVVSAISGIIAGFILFRRK